MGPNGDIFFRFVFNLAVPPALILLASRFISPHAIGLPSWVVNLAIVLSSPVVFALRVSWSRLRIRREAAAAGAVLPKECPGKLPGNIDTLYKMMDEFNNGYPGERQATMFPEVHHTFNLRLLWEDTIFTSEPEHIKTILSTDFSNYQKGPNFHAAMQSVLGTGVFNSDGEMWKFHRGMTRPFFSRDRISHFELFDRHAEEALEKMKLRLRAGYAVDFQDLISRFTIDSATEFLFGHCVDSLKAPLPYAHGVVPPSQDLARNRSDEFSQAFAEAQYTIASRVRVNWAWPLLEISGDKTSASMKVVNSYLDPILENAVRKAKINPPAHNDKDQIDENETLLDHLVKYTSDPKVLRDETLNILIAGRDTTATTLTFVIYLLSSHPETLDRLRAEIITHVGLSRRPTYDDIRDMKFLRAVINETLRLFPAVPFNTRSSINATTWSSKEPHGKPFYIPANTKTAYSVLMMHRRKDLWGPDAEEFDPDRFLDERLKKYLTPNPFIFLPFNGGPRICLGQQFAYNEMSFFLIRLLQNFDSISLDLDSLSPEHRVPESWKLAQGRQRVEKFRPKVHLTLYSGGGMWVKMREVEKPKA